NGAFVQVSVNLQVEYTGLVSGLTGITINEGAAVDTVNIEKDFGIPIFVNMGSGRDDVNISPLAENFDAAIQGTVTINRGSGTDSLSVDDRNNTAVGLTWTVTGSSIFDSNLFSGAVHYNGMDFVTLNTGPGSFAIDVAPVGQNLDAIR